MEWIPSALLVLAMVAVLGVSIWLQLNRHRFRRPFLLTLKELIMPTTPATNPLANRPDLPSHDGAGTVLNIFAEGGDINDIAHLREQDQAVAQLGAQLDSLTGSPWVEVEAKEMYDMSVANKSAPIRKVVNQLGCMSVAPAFAGTHQSIVGVGTAITVQMGDRAVSVPSREDQRTLVGKLNGDYARIIGHRQKALIGQINAYSKGGKIDADLPSAAYTLALRAGKTFLVCADQQDREQLRAKLDKAFEAAVSDYAKLIMIELMNATREGMGPDLRSRE